jgi:hypothetical protein
MVKSVRPRKSWAQKMAGSKAHQVKPAPRDFAGMRAGQIMLVPSPQIIDAFIRAIPRGTSMDAKTMRAGLAAAHGAEVACPITTGILLRIVAEAALEAREHGASDVTPFWRVIDEESTTAGKLTCGRAFVGKMRRAEGIA